MFLKHLKNPSSKQTSQVTLFLQKQLAGVFSDLSATVAGIGLLGITVSCLASSVVLSDFGPTGEEDGRLVPPGSQRSA